MDEIESDGLWFQIVGINLSFGLMYVLRCDAQYYSTHLDRPDCCMTDVAVVAVAGEELLCGVPELSATPVDSCLIVFPGLMMRDVKSWVFGCSGVPWGLLLIVAFDCKQNREVNNVKHKN